MSCVLFFFLSLRQLLKVKYGCVEQMCFGLQFIWPLGRGMQKRLHWFYMQMACNIVWQIWD